MGTRRTQRVVKDGNVVVELVRDGCTWLALEQRQDTPVRCDGHSTRYVPYAGTRR